MTTRMYYPHQQAVARHPEKQKKIVINLFFQGGCVKICFLTQPLTFVKTNTPPFYISHAITGKKVVRNYVPHYPIA